MVQNQIHANEQYGFNSGLSLDNASYTLILKIFTAMNNKHIVGGFIVSDLRKEFDYINYGVLLSKLEQYRIIGKCKALIKSYLTESYST